MTKDRDGVSNAPVTPEEVPHDRILLVELVHELCTFLQALTPGKPTAKSGYAGTGLAVDQVGSWRDAWLGELGGVDECVGKTAQAPCIACSPQHGRCLPDCGQLKVWRSLEAADKFAACDSQTGQLTSRRFQQEVDAYGIVRQLNLPFGRLLQDSTGDQGLHVAVHRLHVASDTARRFPNGDGPSPTEPLNEVEAFTAQRTHQRLR
jgi:hypothetical protein